MMALGRPEYLRKKGRKGSQKTIVRWRCGNEEEGALEHIIRHGKIKNRLRIEEIFSEEGKKKTVKWMKEIDRRRKKKKARETEGE